jgi:hypothetical protein
MGSVAEKWKVIPGYPGYEASNFGRARSIDRTTVYMKRTNKAKQWKNCSRNFPGKLLKQSLRGQYLAVSVGGKRISVHRLIALAWLGPPLVGMEVNHKDGQKLNNKLDNLEYVTKSQNALHAFSLGLRKARRVYGENAGNTKLKTSDVLKIRSSLKPARELSKIFGVTDVHIRLIKRRKTWKHLA